MNTVTINGNDLTYFVDGEKYITTFETGKSHDDLKSFCDSKYEEIIKHYTCIKSMNVCGANCQNLCNKLEGVGILYMYGGPTYTKEQQEKLERVYGNQSTTMAVSYHALAYIHIDSYFVAVEVSNHKPYDMQFYISDTQDGLYELIKIRYNVTKINVTMDCDAHWTDVMRGSGSRKRRSHKRRSHKRKSHKRKSHKRRSRKRKSKKRHIFV